MSSYLNLRDYLKVDDQERIQQVVTLSAGKGKLKLFLKRFLFFLLALFLLLSVLPYLIPLQTLEGNSHELTYGNSLFAAVDNIELHYRCWGDSFGKERNILLVHGLGGSTFTWRYTAPYLQANGYRVIAVDLPGFGLSDRQAGFDHSAAARVKLLWLLLDQLDGGGKWDLVGHSMGGATVAAMALQDQGRVKSVTLAAGALSYFEPSLLSLFYQYPPLSRWIRVLGPRLFFNESRIESLLSSAYGRQPTEAEVEGYLQPLMLENTDIVMTELFLSAPAPLLEYVGDLTVPVLCLWGEEDTWVPLGRGEELQALITGSELVVIPGEGHCPMETAPDYFNDILLQFIKYNTFSSR